MRVYDLAKELGKDSSKEILDILEKHDINLKSSSNITDDQASIVRKAMGGAAKSSEGRQNAPAPAKPAGEDSAKTEGSGEPHKKKIDVYKRQVLHGFDTERRGGERRCGAALLSSRIKEYLGLHGGFIGQQARNRPGDGFQHLLYLRGRDVTQRRDAGGKRGAVSAHQFGDAVCVDVYKRQE